MRPRGFDFVKCNASLYGGALAAWSTTVVAEADFFSSEPEAREADEELMQLNRLRERWQPSFPEVDVGGSGLASPCAPSAWGCRVMMSPSSVQPSPSLRPAPLVFATARSCNGCDPGRKQVVRLRLHQRQCQHLKQHRYMK